VDELTGQLRNIKDQYDRQLRELQHSLKAKDASL